MPLNRPNPSEKRDALLMASPSVFIRKASTVSSTFSCSRMTARGIESTSQSAKAMPK